MPRAFAAFKLTTSSNKVGCSTGMSAGLAPLRILSTGSRAPQVVGRRGAVAEKGTRVGNSRDRRDDLNALSNRQFDQALPQVGRQYRSHQDRVDPLLDQTADRSVEVP